MAKLSFTDARVEAPQIDFAALRMAMPQVVEPSDAMAAFKLSYEKAQAEKLTREMKALGLDSAGQPLRNSLPDVTYQPRMPIKATGIRTGSNSIYKPVRSEPIYTPDDALREPDLPSADEDETTPALFE